LDSVLIIGAGAAGSVVAKKCAMNRDVFKKIHLASRRLESCKKVQAAAKSPIDISQVDADNVADNLTANASNEADQIKANAENKADAIKNAADNKADAIKNSADNTTDKK